MIDIERVRADTPGCEQVVHLHHCGASMMPDRVVETVVEHLQLEARVGGYEAAGLRQLALEDTYDEVARFVGAHRDEVALVESATVGWQRAVYALAQQLEPGQAIVTAVASYGSNYLSFLQLERHLGLKIVVVADDEHGQIDISALQDAFEQHDVGLMCLTHVPTNNGLVNPAEAVGEVCKQAGVPFVLDACQSAGQLVLDMDRLGCDVLTATGRKYLRGPRGTGFLVMRRELMDELEPMSLDLRSAVWAPSNDYRLRADARRFETWESSVASRLGLRMALRYAHMLGMGAIEARVTGLANQLRSGLEALPMVTLRDKGERRCGIVSFTHLRMGPEEVRGLLRAQGFQLGVSDAGSTRLDMDARGLDSVVRAGVHYVNTEGELDRLIEAVAGL